MSAVLQFYGYWSELLLFHRNNSYFEQVDHTEGNTINLSPKFSYAIVNNPDNEHQANVLLGVSIGTSPKDKENAPFVLRAVIRGHFEVIDQEMDEENAQRFFTVNALAILFPYLRSVVTNLTAGNEYPPIVLPTVNITKVAIKNDDLFEDYKQLEFYGINQ